MHPKRRPALEPLSTASRARLPHKPRHGPDACPFIAQPARLQPGYDGLQRQRAMVLAVQAGQAHRAIVLAIVGQGNAGIE